MTPTAFTASCTLRVPQLRAAHACSPRRLRRAQAAPRAAIPSDNAAALDGAPSSTSIVAASPLQRKLPTLLTLARIAATPAVAALYLAGYNVSAAGAFMACALTDAVDGILARRWGVCSALGAFLDPVADKLLVCVSLVAVVGRVGGAPLAAAVALTLSREIYVSALREWMAERGIRGVVQVGFLGKVKTACQMVACVLLLAGAPGSPAVALGTIGMVIAAALALLSAVQYTKAAMPALRRDE